MDDENTRKRLEKFGIMSSEVDRDMFSDVNFTWYRLMYMLL